ncbi:MAG: hypothetical protein ACUVRD_05420 [Bacteroidia bacterium]
MDAVSAVIAAASRWELEPFLGCREKGIHFWVGGVGACHVWARLVENPIPPCKALIIIGLAGSYQKSYAPGQWVQVLRDRYGDIGRRYSTRWVPLSAMNLPEKSFPFQAHVLFEDLPGVEGLTLHSVSADRRTARYWKRHYPTAIIETMENAAFFHYAQLKNLPVYGVRLISNYVGERWKPHLYLPRLHDFVAKQLIPWVRVRFGV